MARKSLKELRARIRENEGGGNFQSEFWTPMDNLDMGQSAVLRFIPFEDSVSGSFWTNQKVMFAHFVNPDNPEEPWRALIPCLEMYENKVKCPVADLVRPLFKEADELKKSGMNEEAKAMHKVASPHWIRYTHYFQGFVLRGGNKQISESTLTAFKLPKSMYNIVHNSIMDDENGLDDNPAGWFDMEAVEALQSGNIEAYCDEHDYTEEDFAALFTGRGFVAKKTKKDEYNNYEQSMWEMKENDLTDEQIDAVAQNGFIDLRRFLPERPTDEQYDVMCEMMQISIAHSMDGEDNTWNPEWEEKYGIKPIKPRESEGGSSSGSSGGAATKNKLANRLASKKKASDDGETKEGAASSVRAKLNKSRGAKAAAEETQDDASEDQTEDDQVEETTTSDDAEEEAPAKGKSDRVAALSARLKAKTKAAKEAAEA